MSSVTKQNMINKSYYLAHFRYHRENAFITPFVNNFGPNIENFVNQTYTYCTIFMNTYENSNEYHIQLDSLNLNKHTSAILIFEFVVLCIERGVVNSSFSFDNCPHKNNYETTSYQYFHFHQKISHFEELT
jgi:hypothetical protein